MTQAVSALLRCPQCEGELQETGRGGSERRDLRCIGCGRTYPVVGGIPRMATLSGVRGDVAASFGFQWQARATAQFEKDTLYGLSPEMERRSFFAAFDAERDELAGKTLLDAGCGDGFLISLVAPYLGEVVGIDVNTAIDVAYLRCRNHPNVTIVQGDLFSPPLQYAAFDYVWCEGVLVATEDPRKGFATLSRLVKPGGQLYIWVYSSERLGIYQRIRDAVVIGHRLPRPLLLPLCYGLALPLAAAQWLRGKAESLRTIAFSLFDNLSPRIQTRHTVAEITSWFVEEGFTDVRQIGWLGMTGKKVQ